MRGSSWAPRSAIGRLVAVLVVGAICGSCSTASSTRRSLDTAARSTTSLLQRTTWTSPDGAFSVTWTGGDVRPKKATFPTGAVPFMSYSNVVESVHLVEHVESETNSDPTSMTGVLRLWTTACVGTSTIWQGLPAVRCSGNYRPVDIGRIAYATLQELGISRITDARQDVLIVRDSPTHVYIVDAISTSKAGLADGGDFVRSFHVAPS